MEEGFSLLSSTILRTAGDRGALPAGAAAGAGGGEGGAEATGAAAGAAVLLAFAGAAFLPLPSPIIPRRVPTFTELPWGTAISEITPEAWAFTSSVTLSVSSSTRGSSVRTE